MKISFVLPCYNVAPYIGRCFDSLLEQDMPKEDYEIICVDDCSLDNTVQVIEEYREKYDNIKLIKHKVNKTSGGARNTGLYNAQGEYVWFVDPDDCILPNVLGGLYQRARDLDTEMLFFNMSRIDENGVFHLGEQFPTIDEIMTGPVFVQKYCPQKHLAGITSVCRCLYKRDYCVGHDLHYPEIKSSQDVIFIWKCILEATRVSSISSANYVYHRRLNSMTGNKGSYLADATLSASLLFPNEVLNILNEYESSFPCFVEDLKTVIRRAVNDNSRKVLLMNKEEQRKFYYLVRDYRSGVVLLFDSMNRKTRLIFNYKLPYLLWTIMISLMKKRTIN